VSYYLSKILKSIGITAQRDQTMLNGILTTVNYATGIMAALMTQRVARRTMFVGGAVGMWFTFSALTISIAVYNEQHTVASGRSALGFIFIYYTFYNMCLNPLLYLYPTEILPYKLRAMGLSVLVFSNKMALFFNQFVNPIGMDSLGWKYYLFYVGFILVEIVVFFFLYPETHGYSLEKVGEVFDGPQLPSDFSEKDIMAETVETTQTPVVAKV
jgi:MFS family permease